MGPRPLRRVLPSFLLAAALGIAAAGCGNAPQVPGEQDTAAGAPAAAEAENFLWVFGSLFRNSTLYTNLLAFAGRHDLSIILAPASVTQTPEARDEIRRALVQARDRDIPVLFNTGVFPERHGWPTGAMIVEDPEWRARYVEALQEAAGLYLDLFPAGRVIVGHEDPLFSNWPARNEENYRRHGAAMFQLQREAVKGVDPDATVGIFILPSNIREMYAVFMPRLERVHAVPDFNMMDKYRGYSDPRLGIEGTNEQTRLLLRNMKRLTRDRPVYYLGQDHTINTGYTPSRRAIREHARVAVEEGVEGAGWYIRTRYVPTDSVSEVEGLEPFHANRGEVDEDAYNTFTGDRDRFMFAYLTLFELQGRLDPAERFDLWVHGTDLDLHEASLLLRDAGGDWRFIGDIGTYVGGDNPYTLEERTGAVVFRALRQEQFLLPDGDGGRRIDVRVVPRAGTDGLAIRSVHALPYAHTDRFITELEAGDRLAADRDGVRERSVAYRAWDRPVRLRHGDTLEAGGR